MKNLWIVPLVFALISNANAWSVSGHVSGGAGLALRAVMAIPVTFDTYYAAVAIPLINNYSFADLPEGQYYLMAFQDVNGNQQPDVSEPRGVYGGVFAQVLSVNQNWTNRNITIGTPAAGGFDGTLSYTGTQSSFSLLGAFDNPQCTGQIYGGGFLLETSGNGSYFTFLTAPGTYYVYAIMDVNSNYRWDEGEPIGYYGGMVRAPLEITNTNFPHNIDITMNDVRQLPPSPVISHDPLADQILASFNITARIADPFIPFSANLFYRTLGTAGYNSLPLAATGNPDEYFTSLGPLGEGSYEYFLQATDIYGSSSSNSLDTFRVGEAAGSELAYDDGSAEAYNWSDADPGDLAQWAVKFGPVQTPFLLYGARFSASRSLPDNLHSRIVLRVFETDPGTGGPGNLLYERLAGSVGNVVGGLPAGTNWARVILRDETGLPLVVNTPNFFISVSNADSASLESFGRDTGGLFQHRSYFLDPCLGDWMNEDSTVNPNAHPGNRLIRAVGSPLVPPEVVIYRSGNTVQLGWNNVAAPYYRIYSWINAAGTFNWLATVTGTTFTDSTAFTGDRKFYTVRASTTP
jgi:hypothetical protein